MWIVVAVLDRAALAVLETFSFHGNKWTIFRAFSMFTVEIPMGIFLLFPAVWHPLTPRSWAPWQPHWVITSWPCLIYHRRCGSYCHFSCTPPGPLSPRPWLQHTYSLPPVGSERQAEIVTFLLLSKRLSYLFFAFFLAAPCGTCRILVLPSGTEPGPLAVKAPSPQGNSRKLSYLLWLPSWHSGEGSAWQCRRRRRCGFSPWAQKIPWRREVTTHCSNLPGKFPWTGEAGILHSVGSQRLGRDLVTERTHPT